jgi:hypothetical protein
MARVEDSMRIKKPRVRTAVKRNFPNPKRHPYQNMEEYIRRFDTLNRLKPVTYTFQGAKV